MKKILLSVLSLAMSVGLWADDLISLDYSPADSYATAVAMENQVKGQGFAQAFQLTSDITETFDGCEITSFNFHAPSHSRQHINRIHDYTIFITEDLRQEPFYTQEFTTTTDTQFAKLKVKLDTPYKIEAGKRVYFGMKYKLESQYDESFVVDGQKHDNDFSAGWIGILQDDGTYLWDNYTEKLTFLCLGVTIQGTNMPANQVSVESITTQSVLTPGEPLSFKLLFRNTGATPVKLIETEYTIGDNAPISEPYDFGKKAIAFNKSGILTFSGITYDKVSDDPITITAKVTYINDVANVGQPNSASTSFYCLNSGSGFEKQVVIEEITGTWCQWCPGGIITMERIREEYPNGGVIPVCVHFQDEMSQSSWYDISTMSNGAAPYAFYNRYSSGSPIEYSEVIAACNTLRAIPALGKVDVEASFDNSAHKVDITATTEFAISFSDPDRYRLSFAITQDNVGPYSQLNGYSGNPQEYGGWEKLPSEVDTYFNDVALILDSKDGIKNSIPNNIEAGKEYTFTRTIEIPVNVPMDQLNVVAYLIDTNTGIIENAATQKSQAQSAIYLPTADAIDNAPIEYYTIQGIRVNNPQNGIYIRRQGNTVNKVKF